MAARQAESQRSDIRLGDDEFENGYRALVNRKAITENGRLLLATIGDEMERRRVHKKAASSQKTSVYSWLKKIVKTFDRVLTWSERIAEGTTESFKKQEAVLRGIFHLTDLGNQASLFTRLWEASKSFATSEQPFKADRNFILSCLNEIGEKNVRILQLVDEAGEILKAIINDDDLDKQKGLQFDNIVGQANLEIQSCRRRLNSVEERINALSTTASTLKWLWRGVRLIVWLIITGYFCQKYNEGSIGILSLLASSGITGVVLLSLYSRPVNDFHEDLSEMRSTHSQLTEQLTDLRERLSWSQDFRDGRVLAEKAQKNS